MTKKCDVMRQNNGTKHHQQKMDGIVLYHTNRLTVSSDRSNRTEILHGEENLQYTDDDGTDSIKMKAKTMMFFRCRE